MIGTADVGDPPIRVGTFAFGIVGLTSSLLESGNSGIGIIPVGMAGITVPPLRFGGTGIGTMSVAPGIFTVGFAEIFSPLLSIGSNGIDGGVRRGSFSVISGTSGSVGGGGLPVASGIPSVAPGISGTGNTVGKGMLDISGTFGVGIIAGIGIFVISPVGSKSYVTD